MQLCPRLGATTLDLLMLEQPWAIGKWTTSLLESIIKVIVNCFAICYQYVRQEQNLMVDVDMIQYNDAIWG